MLKDLLAQFLNSSPKAILIGPRIKTFEAQSLAHHIGLILIDGARSAFDSKPSSALLIGDGDSCLPEVREEFDFLCNPNKSQSDLALVLEYLPETVKELTLLGFRGGRLDHELFNLGELSLWLEKRVGLKFSHGEDLQGFSAGQWKFEINGLFSLMALQESQFTIKGEVAYPLEKQSVAALKSLTLSNQGLGTFEIICNKPFFLYRN